MFGRHLSSSSSEDVFKMSWSRRINSPDSYVFRRRFEDVFKTFWSRPVYLSLSYVFNASSRRFQDVIKTQDVLLRRLQHLFKTSSRRLVKTSWRRLDDVFKSFSRSIIKLNCSRLHVLKISSRRIQNVFKTYSKDGIYERICLGPTSNKFMVNVQYLQG